MAADASHFLLVLGIWWHSGNWIGHENPLHHRTVIEARGIVVNGGEVTHDQVENLC